jgi:hypothetical protein
MIDLEDEQKNYLLIKNIMVAENSLQKKRLEQIVGPIFFSTVQ